MDGWIHCNGESTSAKGTTLTYLYTGKNLGYTITSGLWQNAGIEYRCLAQRPRTPSEEKWGHLNHSGWTRRDRVLSANHYASAAQSCRSSSRTRHSAEIAIHLFKSWTRHFATFAVEPLFITHASLRRVRGTHKHAFSRILHEAITDDI